MSGIDRTVSRRASGRRSGWPGRLLCRLVGNRAGNVVVELAVAAPVLALLFAGLLETATVMFTNSIMEGAASEAGRRIRTGQIQQAGTTLDTFRSDLCTSLFNIMDCSQIVIDVRNFTDYSGISLTLQVDENGDPVNPAFSPGGPETITLVRIMYRWNFITPLIGHMLSDNGTNSTLLISTAVFQNEPYAVTGP